MAIFEV